LQALGGILKETAVRATPALRATIEARIDV